MTGSNMICKCPHLVIIFLMITFFSVVSASNSPYESSDTRRIEVDATGLYRVSFSSLGISSVRSDTVRLSNRGQSIAIELQDGGDGWFGAGDSIIFYGQPVLKTDPEFRYATKNIYWFETGGDVLVSRIEGVVSPAPVMDISSYRHVAHVEKDWTYFQSLKKAQGQDRWFWKKLRHGDSFSTVINVDNVVGSSGIVLRVAMHGETTKTHHTRMFLNGSYIKEIPWNGDKYIEHEILLNSSYLVEGDNTVVVEQLLSDENSNTFHADNAYIDWVEIEYEREFVAINNQLKFSIDAFYPSSINIDNFSGGGVRLYDITDAVRPVRVAMSQNELDFSRYEFIYPADSARSYIAVSADGIKPAVIKGGRRGAALRAGDLSADYILITHDDLLASAQRLANHRTQAGLNVMVATVDDIYDQFGHGFQTPDAIRAFLRAAYLGGDADASRYVALVGDANWDYKDNYLTGQKNLVPTYMVETEGFGEAPSDARFAVFDGMGKMPVMRIGRIPAKNTSQLTAYIDKVIEYESGMPGSWPNRMLMVSGDRLSGVQLRGGADIVFRDTTDAWRDKIPESFGVVDLNPDDYIYNNQLRVDFSNELNDKGVTLVSYFGHGSVDRWMPSLFSSARSGEPLKLLTSGDIDELDNTRAYPFFVAFNCLNGLFAMPQEGKTIILPDGSDVSYLRPIPESLLFRRGAGGIAMWAPTAFAYPTEQKIIGDEFFTALFETYKPVLGDVVTVAMTRAYATGEVRDFNIDVFALFGDPALQLEVGREAVSTSYVQKDTAGGGALSWLLILLLVILGRAFRCFSVRPVIPQQYP